jgi:hypothetical protein
VAMTIPGVEPAEKIRKPQLKIGNPSRRPISAPDVCAAGLAA